MPISPSARKSQIAVTLGDAAGIGPEVALKALSRLPKNKQARIILIGKAAFYEKLARQLKLKLFFEDTADAGSPCKNSIRCYFPENFPKTLSYGHSQKEWMRAAVLSIQTAARLALLGKVRAIVTPPINKAGLKKAGFNIPGHTEYLASLSKTKRFEMMLVGARLPGGQGPLRVALVTRHVPIARVAAELSRKRIVECANLTIDELKRFFGIKKPRIVVCGLNPHAGEQGTIGKEDRTIIVPAVRELQKRRDAVVVGPLSPDALFYDAYSGKYDAEICMYHDQGLIPLKMISRGHGVNITLGLPFARTSPDHGTAYDIAGQNKADAGSMLEAINLAFQCLA